ncbi:metallophosphoesterase [Photobacterium sp.]|uniref:metallophosphoesterase n=1 Tax=Photobacterium sp. TaxID=660 RepID=UPI00299CF70E|nr:metallophosphoesterase [Photobacterium sp.]MDX1301540.1 metallophosphoesterase [Photobacterium sp.]
MHQLIQLEQGSEFEIYFISDIHGQFGLLMDVLNIIGFRFPVDGRVQDRLFILGDLIDRGNQSLSVLGAARYNPAIVSLAGNHEIMAHKALSGDAQSALLWAYNGGLWRDDHDLYHLTDMIRYAAAQPVAITLEVGGDRIGLVHAGVPAPYHWDVLVTSIDNATVSESDLDWMLSDRSAFLSGAATIVQGVGAVLHGHNIVEALWPVVRGNCCYIDGGMAYGDRALVLKYQQKGTILGMFEAYSFRRDPISSKLFRL